MTKNKDRMKISLQTMKTCASEWVFGFVLGAWGRMNMVSFVVSSRMVSWLNRKKFSKTGVT